MVELEKLGVPTICIVSDAFESMARARARALGLTDPLIALCDHPIGGITAEDLARRVDQLTGEILRYFTS